MAAKPLTTEAIAFTEKKMDMTLDEIIKMTKKTTSKEEKAPRRPIKSQGFLNSIAAQRNNRVWSFMDSRSSIRQGVLAQRRSNFRGNQFPLTANAARRASVMPVRNMAVMPSHNMTVNRNKLRPTAQRKAADGRVAGKDSNPKQRPQTMDALFANMKEKRMMVFSSQRPTFQDYNQNAPRHHAQQQQQLRGGGRGGSLPQRQRRQQQQGGFRGGARPGRW